MWHMLPGLGRAIQGDRGNSSESPISDAIFFLVRKSKIRGGGGNWNSYLETKKKIKVGQGKSF